MHVVLPDLLKRQTFLLITTRDDNVTL